MNIKKSILLRARLGFLAVLLFAFAVVWRLVQIQTVEGEKWRNMAEQHIFKVRDLPAVRGNIYSDNGSLLATSLPFYKVSLDPVVAKDEIFNSGIDSLAWHLSNFFDDRSKEDYKRRIKDARLVRKRYYKISNRLLNYQEKKTMESWPIFREGRLKGGIIFERVDKRFRPFNDLGLRTVGFITEDNHGAGLEYSFNKELAGQNGKALFQKMSGGAWKPIFDGSDIKPAQGYDLQTTIDVNLQDVAESALKRHLKEHNANYGCVVLMEVKTGEIKAMSNLGRTEEGRYIENYNYAVGSQGLTEPGSTMKLASLMALLEDGNLEITDSINTGNGVYEFYNKKMTDTKEGGYGKISVKQAFEVSSNVAVSKLVYDRFSSNPQRYIDYLEQFGLTQPIGFQMEGEAKPYVKRPKDKSWSGITLPWMSIGYEVKISPLHMLTFYNAVANNGTMISPILVKSVRNADRTVEEFEAQVIKDKICSKKTLSKVKTMLEGVVLNGTAKNIRNTNYTIAGKTGTAQRIVNGKYIKRYYTSFIGYFPAEAPKYSCIVVIDNPQGYRQYATEVAAPVFKEIADKIYATDILIHKPMKTERIAQQGVFPTLKAGQLDDMKMLCNFLGISNHAKGDYDWVAAKPNNNAIVWAQKDPIKGLVPDVYGMTPRDALYLLENAGLKVVMEGKGRVKTQSLSAGKKLNKGETIYIRLDS